MWEGNYQGADKNSRSQTQCSCSVSPLNWQILCAWQALDTRRNTTLNIWGFAGKLFKTDCKREQTPQRAAEVHITLIPSATTLSLLTPSNTHTLPMMLSCLREWWWAEHSHTKLLPPCQCKWSATGELKIRLVGSLIRWVTQNHSVP